MKKIVPNEFLNVLTDLQKEKSFELIKSVIETVWGHEVIYSGDNVNPRFHYGLVIEDYLETIPMDFENNIPELTIRKSDYFNGILTFDKVHNRFVIFQIVDQFEGLKGLELKVKSVLKNERIYRSRVIDNEIILRFISQEINYELTKLIVLSFHIPTTQMIYYLSPSDLSYEFSGGYELWKIDSLNNMVYIEKVQNDFNEDSYDGVLKESDYLIKHCFPDSLVLRYNLFKEYLRFKFNCRLHIRSEIDIPKLYELINYLQIEYVDYTEEGELNVTEDTLQSYVDDLVNQFNNNPSRKEMITKLDSFVYRFIRIDVLTQGLNFNLSFVINFGVEQFTISMYYLDKRNENIFYKYVNLLMVNTSNTYQDFENFVDPIFSVFEEYEKVIMEEQKKKELEIEKQNKSVEDLPF